MSRSSVQKFIFIIIVIVGIGLLAALTWSRFTREEGGFKIGPAGVFVSSCGSAIPITCRWTEVNADWKTFRVLSDSFSADDQTVFLKVRGVPMTSVRPLTGADPGTFYVLDDEEKNFLKIPLGIDSTHVYSADPLTGAVDRFSLDTFPSSALDRPIPLTEGSGASIKSESLFVYVAHIGRCARFNVCIQPGSLKASIVVVDRDHQLSKKILADFQSTELKSIPVQLSSEYVIDIRPGIASDIEIVIRKADSSSRK